jgi:TolB protein
MAVSPALAAPQAPPAGTPTIVIGGPQAPRVAIADCVPRREDPELRAACGTIGQVLRADLRFEGLFQFVPDSLLRAIPPLNPDAPNMEDWKSIGAGVLVVTRVDGSATELSVDLRVFFVESGQVMLAKRYAGPAKNPRVFAHQASDDIVALTQNRGVARTRIAFSSDRDASRERRAKEIYIMDYDGHNPRRVTVNNSLNILPAWSPDGQALAYVSYRQGRPLVFLSRIYQGTNTPNLTGENESSQAFAPTFSPDGSRIAWASNRSGNMEVWVANADGSGAHAVTRSAASDTAPTWSPTGREIAFTSNRGGTPQIYVMDAEGLNVRRLSTVGNYNDAPAWNPARQFLEVAFTSRLDGQFQIAIVDLATGQTRQITENRGSCEYPTWAPSGRHLAFSCQRGGTWQIHVADREGRTVQPLQAGPGSNVQPDWSN